MLPSGDVTASMSSAIDMMKEHFHRKSGSSSASFVNHSWFSATPDLGRYDPQMVNILLRLARDNLAGIFRILDEFHAPRSAPGYFIIAMAAVGALYCDVEGCRTVAKACYNDARRIVLAAVC